MGFCSFALRGLAIVSTLACPVFGDYFAAATAYSSGGCEDLVESMDSGLFLAAAEATSSCGPVGAFALATDMSVSVENYDRDWDGSNDDTFATAYAEASFEVEIDSLGYKDWGYLKYRAYIFQDGDAGPADVLLDHYPIDINVGVSIILVDFSVPVTASAWARTIPYNGRTYAGFEVLGIYDRKMNLVEPGGIQEIPEPAYAPGLLLLTVALSYRSLRTRR